MDLSEILSSLTQDDINKLKTTANELMNNISAKPDSDSVNGDIIKAVTSVEKLINTNDDRYNLIMALKPMLSEPRQERAEQAAKILKLISVIPVLKENGLLNGLI